MEVGETIEDNIDNTRRRLRQKYVGILEQDGSNRAQCLAVLDTLDHLEEIGDRAVGIIRCAEETQAPTPPTGRKHPSPVLRQSSPVQR